jgi:uncharacterized protein YkwD
MELHTCFPVTKTVRMLRQTLRAAAAANFLDTGELELPDYGRQKSVLFRTRGQYVGAVNALVASKTVSVEQGALATARGMDSWRFTDLDPALQLCSFQNEADAEAMWLTTLEYWRGKYPCLTGGRVNLVCRQLLGRPMPRMAEVVATARVRDPRTVVAPAASAERELWSVLASAGMRGGRLWMRYLARCGEDPAWTATMHERLATLQGDELLKATLMVEFLAEEDRLVGLSSRAEESQRPGQAEALAVGLGEDLGELDRRWRTWLVGIEPGVVQRLRQEAAAKPASPVLEMLRGIREKAGCRSPLELDDELSAGCRNHARYLAVNRDQTERWPDMHEEYADRTGWTSSGSMAGLASVAVAGIKSDEQAVAGWMATFYHRLPLLEPGLRRIGFAREGDVAVLDCRSMVDPRLDAQDELVLWPYDGMTNTPVAFAPEMPNPVVNEDQSMFGYPITVQYSRRSSGLAVDARMTLRQRNERGDEVACWFTSPQTPGNELVVPANAVCLIPKRPLQRGATYWVQVEFVGEALKHSWTFKT